MAVGRLDELLAALPYHFEEICLCRGKKGDLRLRSYSLERMMQLSSFAKSYGGYLKSCEAAAKQEAGDS
jgi:hypothetical protein